MSAGNSNMVKSSHTGRNGGQQPAFSGRGLALIVHDRESPRLRIQRLVAEPDCGVFGAKNGQEAVSILGEHAVNVLVSNLFMPEMDGLELMRTALHMQPGIRVIVLIRGTEYETYGPVATALGAHAIARMPLNPGEFKNVFRTLLAGGEQLLPQSSVPAKSQHHALMREAAQLESNVAILYRRFAELYTGDSVFWYRLAVEEENHAALVRSMARDPRGQAYLSDLLIDVSRKMLAQTNRRVLAILHKHQKGGHNRLEALDDAMHVEDSAGEYHYRLALKGRNEPLGRLASRLSVDDNDHASRICAYLTATVTREG